jgi:hypothetical protein
MPAREQFTTMGPSRFGSAPFVALMFTICGVTFWDFACAQPSDKSGQPQDQPLEEVTVTARKEIDRSTLEHVIVPRFVESHGTPSERIGQVGRWYDGVCPQTTGLRPLYNEYISRRVVEVARSVGAPTKRAGECTDNVEIIFTTQPQELLDHLASKYVTLLGYSERPKQLQQFNHAIQAWYVTGTRSLRTVRSPLPGADRDSSASPTWNASPPALTGGMQIDSPWIALHGQAGSLLGNAERSEFSHVTVIADVHALIEHRLHAVADYIAVLVLTRTALDGCNPLPSIVDLLSPDCGTRARPQGITDADTAFLRALYSSNLELKVNFEKGEMRSRMLKSIEAP